MRRSLPFRLNRSGLMLALVSAAFAGEAAAVAGRVDFAAGGVTVAGRDGQQRPLARGASLDSGDTIRTGAEGRAQIRFTDGSYVSLQPNTDFAISDYRFDGQADGNERGFYSLVRGAMRTVTGAIGRTNRSAYRVSTPTATVGIRGTGGVIQVLNDGSTLIIGTSGIWSLTNPAGSIDVPAGVTGLAPSEPNTPPRESNTQPQTAPAPVQPQETVYTQGDNVAPDGTPDIGIVPLVTGPGYAASVAFGVSFSGVQLSGNANAVFDPQGRLTSVQYSDGQNFTLNGTHGADSKTDGILAWGRWIGNVTGQYMCDGLCPFNQTFADNQGFHYIIGKPTPIMPTNGAVATYTIAGNTTPTFVGGAGGLGEVLGGTLKVTFGGFTTLELQNLAVQMPGIHYTMNGMATTSTSIFSMFPSVAVNGTACSSCQSRAFGFFSGASAERVGLSYSVQGGGQTAVGAVAFKP